MRFEGGEVGVGDVLKNVWNDIMNNHTMALAAGLSYYFVTALFPLLILLAALVAYLPIPNLFEQILGVMSRVVPADGMGLVRKVVASVITPRKGGLLTFGVVGTIWSASGGFAALIEALNVAYDVPETRPIWKTRLLAVALTFICGGLLVVALVVMIMGPKLGEWIANLVHLGPQFMTVWPYIRWGVSAAFVVLGVEMLFFWAPNVKQRFWATLPGAIIGVAFWLGSSYGLGLYFQHFANYNKTYGVLGAAMALMVWLYYSWFMILIGAEINSELVKAGGRGKLALKEAPPAAVTPRAAWEERGPEGTPAEDDRRAA
jgi:membrane protein